MGQIHLECDDYPVSGGRGGGNLDHTVSVTPTSNHCCKNKKNIGPVYRAYNRLFRAGMGVGS